MTVKLKRREQIKIGDKIFYEGINYPIVKISKKSFIRGMWEIGVIDNGKKEYFFMAKNEKVFVGVV